MMNPVGKNFKNKVLSLEKYFVNKYVYRKGTRGKRRFPQVERVLKG